MRCLVGMLVAGCGFNGPAVITTGADAPLASSDASDAATVLDPDGTPLPDGVPCFGGGLLTVCLTSPPDAVLTLSGTIDTDHDGRCLAAFVASCVIAGQSASVGNTIAGGSRPLVIVAEQTLGVNGTLDVSSVRGVRNGAGGGTGACNPAGAGTGDPRGSSGGAGGSFGGVGGAGGDGNTNAGAGDTGTYHVGGVAGASVGASAIRGGCGGGAGGNASAGLIGGAGGAGGGAVYLIAGELIQMTGRVFASGAGGDTSATEAGGGGGGSGGLIGLDAPSIQASGIIAANGGAGSGGGGSVDGAPGGDGTTVAYETIAQGGVGADSHGHGGTGTGGTTTAGMVGEAATGGAGGGGGGVGVVWVRGSLTGSQISPAPSLH